MFENQFIKYELEGKTCVITYKDGFQVDNEFGENIISQKERFQEENDVYNFVGVINWSRVSMKGLSMTQFTSKRALRNVRVVGVVHLSDNRIKRLFLNLGCVFVNWFIPVIERKGIKIKFFTNKQESISWSNEQI